MPPRQEHISIKRIPAKERRQQDVSDETITTTNRPSEPSSDTDLVRRYRIVAILLVVLAALVALSLLSFTVHDADNAQLSMRDVMGVIRGDQDMRVRFDTTHNWVGLIGAVVSHWLIYHTIGMWSLLFPVMLGFWAVDIYRVQRITPRVARRSIVALAASILFTGIIGTLQQITWLPVIDNRWIGAIGLFCAGITTQLIGVPGSLLLLSVGLGFVVILGFRINLTQLGVTATLARATMRDWYASWRGSSTVAQAPEANEAEPQEAASGAAAATPKAEPDAIDRSLTQAVPPLEEPAEMLRPIQQPLQPQALSPAVKILRHVPKSPAPAGTSATPRDEQPPEVTKEKPAVRAVDMDVVQQRLAALHPNRNLDRPAQPTVYSEVPSLEESEDTEEDTLRSYHEENDHSNDDDGLLDQPMLTVVVEEALPEEPVNQVGGTILYDEQIVYKAPTIELLQQSDDDRDVDDTELRNNARILQEKLETFRIKIENLTVQPGPVVTQYEFVPAAGIKVSQIESLGDDIALALKAQGVRIIAPIPGRGTVGIEIPNHHPSVVRFSSIIKSPKYHNPDIRLPIAMGKTVVGDVYCADLAKMPHLLIAGATGKGKSVGINTIIASLLYKMHPRDLKFVIVDPKRVEMTLYKALKDHFLAVSPDINETIITEPANAVSVLKSVVEEMQQRYTILAAAGQRNIADYNKRAAEGLLKDKGGLQHRPMPYIVVIIDELADLMMTASKEVEEPIVRLAQLARAVGIHCVVATQRPSVDVVTGLIKANFPARIAYQVASRIDSRTILDANGAEHLIGNGDMLFNPGNMTKPIRMQNAFISTEEVEAICEHIGQQRGYSTPYTLPSIAQKRGAASGGGGDNDVLFEEAARIFIALQQASVSTLQRRLKIGYARAARIVDELEMAGIVGPPDGSKGRQVLLMSESELEAYL